MLSPSVKLAPLTPVTRRLKRIEEYHTSNEFYQYGVIIPYKIKYKQHPFVSPTHRLRRNLEPIQPKKHLYTENVDPNIKPLYSLPKCFAHDAVYDMSDDDVVFEDPLALPSERRSISIKTSIETPKMEKELRRRKPSFQRNHKSTTYNTRIAEKENESCYETMMKPSGLFECYGSIGLERIYGASQCVQLYHVYPRMAPPLSP